VIEARLKDSVTLNFTMKKKNQNVKTKKYTMDKFLTKKHEVYSLSY
jgi:hypothetical protein